MISGLLVAALTGPSAIEIPRVTLLPDRPQPYLMRDWRQVTRDYDRLVFDLDGKGQYLPLVWRVPGVPHMKVPGFGMPSYVGGNPPHGKTGESLTCLGAVLGATMAGIDKSVGPVDWVALCEQYFNPSQGLVLNNPDAGTGDSFWYDLLPSVIFTQISSRYPKWTHGREISKTIADTWLTGIAAMDGNFDHTSYDFAKGKPFDNNQWKEPDSAAAIAYLELYQGLKSGDSKYLTGANQALNALQVRDTNPTYEVLTAYGALSAAYLNAERKGNWDVSRFVDWCFDPTAKFRTGWGMVAGRWGGYDVGGLMGSTNDGGGYAFAMNSFINAATLAPVARYDDRFSASMAKWVLNLANASRLYYRNGLPDSNQSSSDWHADRASTISYEGLRRTWIGVAPYGTGDAKRGNDAKTDFGMYGSGYVGLLGALVKTTDVPMILRIDLRATDFLPVRGYPTELLWNPYETSKTVTLNVGSKPTRLYDAVGNRMLTTRPIRGSFRLTLNRKQAVQVVQIPALGALFYKGNETLVGGVPIDYDNGRGRLPSFARVAPADASIAVPVAHVQNAPTDWDALKTGTIQLVAGGGGTMRSDVRFAWNERFLYFRIDQRAPATELKEAPDRKELLRHWWDFEDVTLSFDPGRGMYPVANVPELNLGWSSTNRTDLAVSQDLKDSDVSIQTGGTASANDRFIEGRIAWSGVDRVFGAPRSAAHPGARIACQPLLVDGTFKRQAYIGGAPYARPTGFDPNSRTLVLESG